MHIIAAAGEELHRRMRASGEIAESFPSVLSNDYAMACVSPCVGMVSGPGIDAMVRIDAIQRTCQVTIAKVDDYSATSVFGNVDDGGFPSQGLHQRILEIIGVPAQ
ncbi:MAG: hypothetical protein ACRC2H_01165 [Silanimonas sp.]